MEWLLNAAQFPLFCAVVLIGTSLLLVSTLPIWSFKNFKVPSEYVLPLLLGTGAYAAVLLADPWAAMAAAGLIYLGMLPFSVRSFRRLRREAEAPRDDSDVGAAGERLKRYFPAQPPGVGAGADEIGGQGGGVALGRS